VGPEETFDPGEFKHAVRAEWQAAAAGWREWYSVLEAARPDTEKLVELTGIGPGDAVLDVAAGYGEPGLTAARTISPGGRVVCTDISAPMLAFARERAADADLDNVEFLECDAEDLRFEPETFDAVISRAGLMYLVDVAAALRQLRSFLKPGGRLAAAVWGPPDTVQFATPARIILDELALPAPAPGRPGVFALADAQRLASLVSGAGFRDVETGTVSVAFEADSPQEFTRFIRDVAPPFTALVAGESPHVQERVWRKVTEAWSPFVTADGRVRTENQAIWVAGTNPG
jgi:SAM-dependent methyltransferase